MHIHTQDILYVIFSTETSYINIPELYDNKSLWGGKVGGKFVRHLMS